MPNKWRQALRNPLALSGFIIIFGILLLAILAPFIAPYDPNAIDVKAILLGPSLQHPMGTDGLGRDVFSRMLFGARISLLVGIVAVGIATSIGIVLGAISGYYRGWVDVVIMRLVDVMLSIPTFFLILAVIAFLTPSIWNIMIVIGLTSWMGVTRLVRAEFLSLRGREFVMASETLGARDFRMIFIHMLPNSLTPIMVSFVLGVASAVLVESGLSFLGLGVQAPQASWGNILTDGKEYIQFAWWLSLFPGVAILLTVLGYNLLGEGLRDVLDPRTNNTR
ncbi:MULTISPECIES: ABC transporter permease [Methylovorus]|jgi:peptide/nickel transport system permease protein|uniref:Binding-protein-dependent transport systems inner membrane component n=1 Tax=Methylovorus glucosotrophus (strain SIP3-4) TaxID=582744 RepID=C6XDS5_METGS|nr:MULTISPECIES: ABC transporter permease [Methylovorus]ACT50700.1 binding-protein-dependent transport systems inner membrane component [Methylovorus glucosotrophus SIP3-4]ADQ84688.1 binding-protein-dependent transport systems inner membrane component [Methylovorus sp. MP688]KAF0843891.1 peptide/nickel transport system permease protein [Methylovorus glucosotrophus]